MRSSLGPFPALGLGQGQVSWLPGLEGGLAPKESTARLALVPEEKEASGLT